MVPQAPHHLIINIARPDPRNAPALNSVASAHRRRQARRWSGSFLTLTRWPRDGPNFCPAYRPPGPGRGEVRSRCSYGQGRNMEERASYSKYASASDYLLDLRWSFNLNTFTIPLVANAEVVRGLHPLGGVVEGPVAHFVNRHEYLLGGIARQP